LGESSGKSELNISPVFCTDQRKLTINLREKEKMPSSSNVSKRNGFWRNLTIGQMQRDDSAVPNISNHFMDLVTIYEDDISPSFLDLLIIFAIDLSIHILNTSPL
jgi:hypothetical protein